MVMAQVVPPYFVRNDAFLMLPARDSDHLLSNLNS